MLKSSFTAALFLLKIQAAVAQLPVDSISETEVSRLLHVLASDSLKGRGNYSAELHQAARFIEQEFVHAGLKKVLPYYLQPFTTKNVTARETAPDSAGGYNPQNVLFNVIAMLPGKSLSGEIILFSAHYDHVGTGERKRKDSIYNGANDNASGTTGSLSLASYFAKRADNERTLIFCAFAGEELGLFGSKYFVEHFNTNAVKAVINIEMIGRTTSGKNAFFITGAAQSSFKKIMQKALKGSEVKIISEPAAEKQLFMRSDNYPFAQKGIPAHTLMCSDDSDGCYHQACDEVQRIDIPNMTKIIKAIALASSTIISGAETPVLYGSTDK